MDRWIEQHVHDLLWPLAQALAEKHVTRFPDSLQVVQESMDRLQARGKVTVEINIPRSPDPSPTVGPSPYEAQKAEQDPWES